MFIVNYVVLLILKFGFITTQQHQAHACIFISKNKDTAFVDYEKKTDTAIFKILVSKNGHQIKAPNKRDLYSLTIIKQKNSESSFFLVEKAVNGKYYNQASRSVKFFARKKGNIKTLYPRMVEEPTAFIFRGKIKFGCLVAYRLQKNNMSGMLQLTYSPDFGPISLYINDGGEDTDATIAESFTLISIDGQAKEEFLRKICR